VVFVPGLSDPITAISSQKPTTPPTTRPTTTNSNPQYTKERRLTPNSRNIHQNWMSLSPGLGFAGLLYLDWQGLQQQNPPPLEDGDEKKRTRMTKRTTKETNTIAALALSTRRKNTKIERHLFLKTRY
jgi:hypothetical protein